MTQGTLGAVYRRLATPTQQLDPELIADWEWATVTGLSPLRVRRDTDTAASAATPATLTGTDSLAVGDRVMTIIVKGSLIVIGRYGGSSSFGHAVDVAATSVSWNDIVTPGTYPHLMHVTNNPNGPNWTAPSGSGYYYVDVHTYSGGGNLTQVGTPYFQQDPIVMRTRYGGVWSAWRFIGSSVPNAIKVTKATDQNLASTSTWYRMAWDTTQFNLMPGFTFTGGNIVVANADYYEADVSLSWDPIDGTPRRIVQLETGTTPGSNELTRVEQTSYDYWVTTLRWKGYVAAGTTLGVSVWSASTNSYPKASYSSFTLQRMTG